MGNYSKVKMPKDIQKKCHKAIHSASVAAAAAGAIPIPVADTIPITAAQIAMVIALGKAFDVTISQSAAKSIAGVAVVRSAGRAIVANALKAIPGVGTVAGGVISASTAASLTEVFGWIVADDFYRMSQGEEPEDLIQVASDLKGAFAE